MLKKSSASIKGLSLDFFGTVRLFHNFYINFCFSYWAMGPSLEMETLCWSRLHHCLFGASTGLLNEFSPSLCNGLNLDISCCTIHIHYSIFYPRLLKIASMQRIKCFLSNEKLLKYRRKRISDGKHLWDRRATIWTYFLILKPNLNKGLRR